ncbi:MAG: zinc ABC transporter solute-binding protein [Thermococci archaeon]|nr:zinc ABC transporter solute-binding protein [Thermococci archaeon]
MKGGKGTRKRPRNRGFRLLGLISVFLIASLLLPSIPSAGASSPKPIVVATIGPLASIVRETFGSSVQVYTLIPPGVDPHEYQLTAKQINLVKEADVIVTTGGHLPVEKMMAELKSEGSLRGELLLADDYERCGFRYLRETWYHNGTNPHGVWLDPYNAIAIAEATEKALISAHPPNAAVYRQDFERFRDRVLEIVKAYEPLLRNRSGSVVIQQPSIQYAVSWMGLKVVGAIKPEEEAPALGVDEVLPAARRADLIVYSNQSSAQLRKAALELASKAGKPAVGVYVFWGKGNYTEFLINNTASIIRAMGEKPVVIKQERSGHAYAVAAFFVALSLGLAFGYLMRW